MRRLEPVFDPGLPDKQDGFRLSQCTTDQVFKLTYDIEHRFEENKSGIVLADLTAAYDSLLYGTKTLRLTTVFDLQQLLWTKFSELAKNKKCAFFHKISRTNYTKFILFLISMISVQCVD